MNKKQKKNEYMKRYRRTERGRAICKEVASKYYQKIKKAREEIKNAPDDLSDLKDII